MQFPGTVSTLLILCILAASGFTAGCEDRYPTRDIHVIRTDAAGSPLWTITIADGRDESAYDILETQDGGFAIAGQVAERHGAPDYPRVIRLSRNGTVLWDRTLDMTSVYATSLALSDDGGVVVGENIDNHGKGIVTRLDSGGRLLWSQLFDSTITGVTALPGDRFACAGSRTRIIGSDGTTLIDVPSGSTLIIPTADGGYAIAAEGPDYYDTPVSRLDTNGTVLWSKPLGHILYGRIALLEENPDGTLDVVHSYWDSSRDSDTVMFMQSSVQTRARNGTLVREGTNPAVDPLARTADGGYTFIGYAFPGGGSWTTEANGDGKVHHVRLAPDNTILWDRSYSLGGWTAPIAVRELKEGGYVLLVLTGK